MEYDEIMYFILSVVEQQICWLIKRRIYSVGVGKNESGKKPSLFSYWFECLQTEQKETILIILKEQEKE